MTKMILLAMLPLAVLMSEASAQSRSVYDDSGKFIGSVTTDKTDTVTSVQVRDAAGGLLGSIVTESNGTVTKYDGSGRIFLQFRVTEASESTAKLPPGICRAFRRNTPDH